MCNKYIVARIQVPGIHRWPLASEEYEVLSYPHRHMFFVEVRKKVSHSERDIEFIAFGDKVKKYLESVYPATNFAGCLNFTASSCESIAEKLVNHFSLSYCSVFEDNENGAIVEIQ